MKNLRSIVCISVLFILPPTLAADILDDWSGLVNLEVRVGGQLLCVHPWHVSLTPDGEVIMTGFRSSCVGGDCIGPYTHRVRDTFKMATTTGTCDPGPCTERVEDLNETGPGSFSCSGHAHLRTPVRNAPPFAGLNAPLRPS